MSLTVRLFGFLCVVMTSACARTYSEMYFYPNPVKGIITPRKSEEVAILLDGPGRPYDVLGILQGAKLQPITRGVTERMLVLNCLADK